MIASRSLPMKKLVFHVDWFHSAIITCNLITSLSEFLSEFLTSDFRFFWQSLLILTGFSEVTSIFKIFIWWWISHKLNKLSVGVAYKCSTLVNSIRQFTRVPRLQRAKRPVVSQSRAISFLHLMTWSLDHIGHWPLSSVFLFISV